MVKFRQFNKPKEQKNNCLSNTLFFTTQKSTKMKKKENGNKQTGYSINIRCSAKANSSIAVSKNPLYGANCSFRLRIYKK